MIRSAMHPRSFDVVRLGVLIGIVAGMLAVSSPALACSCAEMDLTTRLPEADGAFVGIYVDRHSVDERRAAWTFEVERVVKGSFGPTAIVRTSSSGASCGIELFDSPRTGLLLDRAEDGVWESSLCQQISPEQLLAFVPNSEPPDPAIPPISDGWSFVSKAIGVGLLLAAAVVLSLRSARRRPSPSGESDVT